MSLRAGVLPAAHNRSVLGALCEAFCEALCEALCEAFCEAFCGALCSLLLAGAAERDSLKAGVTRLVRP
jgi:hypothetical protein